MDFDYPILSSFFNFCCLRQTEKGEENILEVMKLNKNTLH